MVVVAVWARWNDLRTHYTDFPEIEVPLHVPPRFGDGFLPVFESVEKAREYFPDAEIRELHLIPVQRVIKGGQADA